MEGVLMDSPRPFTTTKDGPQYNSELQPQKKKEGNTIVHKIKSKNHGTTTTKKAN